MSSWFDIDAIADSIKSSVDEVESLILIDQNGCLTILHCVLLCLGIQAGGGHEPRQYAGASRAGRK